jgi:replicative DNA helicase
LRCSLGPIRAGDFGFVFARPESGKTTFLADQITNFAEQSTRPIVWFNNEEQGEKVRLRTFQACLGSTTDELWKNKQDKLDKYRALTKGNLKIYDDATIHKAEVEAILREMQPELVVFDQIDKIRGFNADRPDLVFGRIYQWARELAKQYKLAVIGTCQADGTGEGVKWLTMAHVAEAKTSKQAEADWILGIGRSNEGGVESIRYFNISKNKLLGDANTDPNERHGRFDVYIRPMIARYEDLD